MLPAGVMGLVDLGFKKGDTVGIASRTRKEWSEADLIILTAGGVTVGLYPSASLWETTHIVSHSGLQICFVEDDALLDKLLAVQAKTGLPKTMILFETNRKSLPAGVITLEALIARGRSTHQADPTRFETVWQAVRPEDTATIAYTSGTTGPPKGAIITHANLYHTVINATKMHSYEESDFGIAFLPLTHMLQRMSVYAAMHLGIVGAYAESIDKLVENFQELRPTVQVSVPQIFERHLQPGSPDAGFRVASETQDISMGGVCRPGSRALPSGKSITADFSGTETRHRLSSGFSENTQCLWRTGQISFVRGGTHAYLFAGILQCRGAFDSGRLRIDRNRGAGDGESGGAFQIRDSGTTDSRDGGKVCRRR